MTTYKHTVQYYETDKMGVTHHSNYIRFMEEARVNFLKSIGWSYDKMESQGVISPVTNVVCSYKKPTTFSDEIEIDVKISEVTRVKFVVEYTMTANGGVVCTAQSTHCFVSSAGRPISIQKQYPEFHATLCSFVSENEQE